MSEKQAAGQQPMPSVPGAKAEAVATPLQEAIARLRHSFTDHTALGMRLAVIHVADLGLLLEAIEP